MGVEFIKTILYSAQTHTLFFVSEAGSFVIPCIFYRSIPLFMPLYYSVSFYWALSSSFQHFHSPPVSFSPNLFLQTPFHLFFHLGLCLSLDRFPVSGPPRHQCTGNGWGKSWVPPPCVYLSLGVFRFDEIVTLHLNVSSLYLQTGFHLLTLWIIAWNTG